MLVIKARLPAEAEQMFIKAIEAAFEEMPGPETPVDVSAETPNVKWRIDRSARKVDALALVAETGIGAVQSPASLSIAAVHIPAPAPA